MRPSGKIPLWTGGYINQPGVTPPVFLRVIALTLLLTSIGTMIVGVFGIMGHFGGNIDSAIYLTGVTFLFFVAPFVIAYSIITNHPTTRLLLVGFMAATTYYFFDSDIWNPGRLQFVFFLAAVGFFLATFIWLFLSPRARLYFALIQGKTVPDDLAHLVDELVKPTSAERFARRLWQMAEPFSPIFLILLALFLVYAGFSNMTPK